MWVINAHIGEPRRPALALLAKRRYRITRAGLIPDPNEPPCCFEPVRAPSTNAGAAAILTSDTDFFAPFKPATDVLVVARAHSRHGSVTFLDTGVQVGSSAKRIRVWGDRSVALNDAGKPAFSAAQPFVSMPLTWDRAFGGQDLGRFFPQNPSGCGFVVGTTPDRLIGARVPNLEDPASPVSLDACLAPDPTRKPKAVCYSAIDWCAEPRLSCWISNDAQAVDPRFYCAAPAELCAARLRGHEQIRLWNLHPKVELLEVSLPSDIPELLLEPPGCAPRGLTASLQTVLIEPDEERVTLTWTGLLEVAVAYPEEMCRDMRRGVRWKR